MCEKIKSGRSIYFALILAMLLFGCLEKKKEERTNRFKESRQLVLEEIQEIFDSSFVKGSILVFDPQRNIYYSNDFKWANQGKLPASTFKIPNSIIALETGIIDSDSSIIKWDGEKRNLAIWEQNLSFHDAFQFSCVPCYQEIAREIGENRMRKYLANWNMVKWFLTQIALIGSGWLESQQYHNSNKLIFLKDFTMVSFQYLTEQRQ